MYSYCGLCILFFVLFILYCSMYCLCKCVLPPGDNPIAVNKYIISYLCSNWDRTPDSQGCWGYLSRYSDKLQTGRSGHLIQIEVTDYFFPKPVHNSYGAHLNSYSMDGRILFRELGAQGVILTTDFHLGTKDNNEWSYISTPLYAFMTWIRTSRLYFIFSTTTTHNGVGNEN